MIQSDGEDEAEKGSFPSSSTYHGVIDPLIAIDSIVELLSAILMLE